MIKIKNVRPSILIIADAGLKLAPGETREVESLTGQMEKAVGDGLLARIDVEPETKSKSRAAARTAENKGESKKTTAPASTEKQPPASEAGQSDGDQGQLPGADDGAH